MSFVFGFAGAITAESTSGAWFSTPTESVTTLPLAVPSDGMTDTAITSPASPLPATDRSSVSVVEVVEDVVVSGEPFSDHANVHVMGSPSASAGLETVAVIVASLLGVAGVIATEASVGAELATVAEAAAAVPEAVPSEGVTETATTWPRSPLPAAERFSESVVEAVAPVVLTVTPSTVQV